MKRYIKDFKEDELLKLLDENKTLQEHLEQDFYEDQMRWQGDEFEYIFGKDKWNYIDLKDHYNSFYLILKDYRVIDEINKDYLNEDNIKLYNIAKDEYQAFISDDNIEYGSDEYYDKEEKLEKLAKDLIKGIEDQLHKLEKWYSYSREDEKVELIDFYLNCYCINVFENSEYYILDDDFSKVYEDKIQYVIF